MTLIYKTDLEWLSLNYRKMRAEKISDSQRRMILIMFQRDIKYFPSMREIRDGLVEAQIHEIQTKSKNWNDKTCFAQIQSIYQLNWNLLFEMAELGDLDKPLSPKILQNPYHKVTRHILYLYSMESFIYSELNKVSREKDKSKIPFYGAYAAALSYIINSASLFRQDQNIEHDRITLYRGITMDQDQLSTFEISKTINLIGYTSTTKNKKTALGFAFMNKAVGKKPVLFEIDFHGKQGRFELSDEFTAYPGENEVLIQDGLQYLITKNEEIES